MTEPTLPLRARAPLSAGDRIGAYVLSGRELGRGGFGHVVEAIQPVAGLRVAIKIQDCRGEAAAIERATREARALARIHHRHVVRILDAGELETGEQYIAMELLAGETLRELLAREERLSIDRARSILAGIASALDAIHARGIIHRDIKPSNVFLCRDDDGEVYPKLIDFGIAKDLVHAGVDVTRSGAFVGTPSYMSPEQCKGARELDARTDIYSLGLIAYHMLCGRPPYVGDSIDVAYHIVHDPPPPVQTLAPGLPAALDGAFAAILAKRPEERPASATDAVELLVTAIAPGERTPARSRRWLALSAGVLAIALTAGGVYRVTRGSNHGGTREPAGTPPPDAAESIASPGSGGARSSAEGAAESSASPGSGGARSSAEGAAESIAAPARPIDAAVEPRGDARQVRPRARPADINDPEPLPRAR